MEVPLYWGNWFVLQGQPYFMQLQRGGSIHQNFYDKVVLYVIVWLFTTRYQDYSSSSQSDSLEPLTQPWCCSKSFCFEFHLWSLFVRIYTHVPPHPPHHLIKVYYSVLSLHMHTPLLVITFYMVINLSNFIMTLISQDEELHVSSVPRERTDLLRLPNV